MRRAVLLARSIAVLAVLGTATLASANDRCRVMDPTGTPLNIRETPGGRVVGTLPNGMLVAHSETVRDRRGRAWAFLHDRVSGNPIGWVYREFIACF